MSINPSILAKAKTESKIHRCYIRLQGVDCSCKDSYACATCGWNYEVEKKRKEKLVPDIFKEVRDAS